VTGVMIPNMLKRGARIAVKPVTKLFAKNGK
jgi:hypothetical protein